MFEHVEAYAGDPILSLNEDFQRDARQGKVNLSIGIYFDDAGHIPVLGCVAEAERRMLAEGGPKPYLPMEGLAGFRTGVQALLFGANHPVLEAGRVATIQTVGSSSGLKIGADFIRRYFPSATLRVSDPTWENHRAIFEGAGFEVRTYPYYDRATGGLDFAGMLAAFEAMPRGDVVLLHACCHNPTGVDPTAEQWSRLIDVIRDRGLMPFVDIAYQGFGDGIDADAHSIRALASADVSFFVTNSFSKSMSLYGERGGGLSVVCPDAGQADRVLGQLKATVRRNYSSAPIHGGQIVARVLADPALRAAWSADVDGMRARIQAMRLALHDGLVARLPGRDFSYLVTQRGMFSYTGLDPAQVERLREEFGVYLVRSGRMCVAGLNQRNVAVTAEAMAAVLA